MILQGYALSLLLYITYVNGIPNSPEYNTKLAQFADDIALWSTSFKAELSQGNLQESLNNMMMLQMENFKRNPHKSICTIFKKDINIETLKSRNNPFRQTYSKHERSYIFISHF